jgi:hypothetical protein
MEFLRSPRDADFQLSGSTIRVDLCPFDDLPCKNVVDPIAVLNTDYFRRQDTSCIQLHQTIMDRHADAIEVSLFQWPQTDGTIRLDSKGSGQCEG